MGKKLHYKCVDIGKAVNIRQPSTSRKAKTVRRVSEAEANGDEYYDQSSGTTNRKPSGSAAGDVVKKHLQSPVSAHDEALRRTAAGGERSRVLYCRRKHSLNVLFHL